MDRGWLVVPVPRGMGDDERRAHVREQLTAWRAAAARRLPPRVREWAPRLGVAVADVLIRDQRARWGSCDAAGVVRLNWRLVGAAPRLQEYVIVHELAHLRERDHSRDFWAIVGQALSDYEARRASLRQVGPRLVW